MSARRKTAAPTNLQVLARTFGEERWREVVRLFLAMVPRSLFETFMQEAIAAKRLAGNHAYTSRCLSEALQPSEAPFVRALADPGQRYDALQALTVLRERIPEPIHRVAGEIAARPEKFFGIAKLSDPERDLVVRLLPEATAPTGPPAEAFTGPTVFLSHASRDRAAVARIREALERNGIRVWIDTGEIKPGDVIARRIEAGVTAATHFVPVLSPHFLRSSWTQLEEDLAWQREVDEGKVIVAPVLLEGDARQLPLRYRGRRYVDLRRDFAAGVGELVAFLRGPAELSAVRVNPKDGTELVLIPAGPFKAGSQGDPDNPPREMSLPAFYLARYPVTNEQYRKYLDENPKLEKPEFWDNERFNQPQHPVVGVRWNEAEAYSRWAGLRLPTEWEWEKGARGIDGRLYPWGNRQPSEQLANYKMNVGAPTPVGSYPKGASPYGLMDMAGNVWEWTASDYGEESETKTVRGGSFFDRPGYLRAAFRFVYSPGYRFHDIGFRCAQDPDR